MKRFLKVIGVLALCCVGGYIAIGAIRNYAAKKAMHEEFRKAFEQKILQERQRPPVFTLSQFNQIENGMTYAQVFAILGDAVGYEVPMTPPDSKPDDYSWGNPGPDDGYLTVVFQNGVVIEKSQSDLK